MSEFEKQYAQELAKFPRYADLTDEEREEIARRSMTPVPWSDPTSDPIADLIIAGAPRPPVQPGDKVSPLGDRRERPVPCNRCHGSTTNLIPICDPCIERDSRAPSGNSKPKEKK